MIKSEKTTSILTKELESLNDTQLHDLFTFFYKLNNQHGKGVTLTTKKSMQCKAIIKKHSKDFGGTLDDADVMKLCGCSRNSYYKYKREIKAARAEKI